MKVQFLNTYYHCLMDQVHQLHVIEDTSLMCSEIGPSCCNCIIYRFKYKMLIHTCVLDNRTIYVVNELTRSSNQLMNSLV